MRNKYTNYTKFNPTKLPKEFRGLLKLVRVENKCDLRPNEVYWRLKGKLTENQFVKLFKLVDVCDSFTGGGKCYRVFSNVLNKWLIENALSTAYEWNKTIREKVGCTDDRCFSTYCFAYTGLFGCDTFVFDLNIEKDRSAFINEFGEVEHVLPDGNEVLNAVENLPVVREIQDANEKLKRKNPGKDWCELLKAGYVRFQLSSVTKVGNHYIAHIDGGNNGQSDWKTYLKNFNRFFDELSERYDTWLIRFENDCADDVHDIYIGFAEKNGNADGKTKEKKAKSSKSFKKNAKAVN